MQDAGVLPGRRTSWFSSSKKKWSVIVGEDAQAFSQPNTRSGFLSEKREVFEQETCERFRPAGGESLLARVANVRPLAPLRSFPAALDGWHSPRTPSLARASPAQAVQNSSFTPS
jgi:hypothetical protein